MLNKFIYRIYHFILYYFRAKTVYEIDSPFIFSFFKEVLDDNRQYYAFNEIKTLRNALLQNDSQIDRIDFGTGNQHRVQKINEILKKSSISPFKGKLLFRIVKWFEPVKILELGTNLGLSAAYMASTDKSRKLITVEGDPALAGIAQQNIKTLGLSNIQLVQGEFGNVLSNLLKENPDFDLFYIDGNHAKDSTLEYTSMIFKTVPNRFLIVFDDIYWSADMTAAWKEIQSYQEFNIKVDLYHWGLAGNIPGLIGNNNFTLISTKYKFYKPGFFR